MGRKRSNGQGSVFKNESRNRWEAHLVVGFDDKGRPKRKIFTARTRAEVEARLDEAQSALDQGLQIPDNRTTIEEFATWWLDDVMPGEGLAPKTEQYYRDVMSAYVVPSVGHRTLTGPRALTPADVEHMTSTLMRNGYSHRVALAARTATSKMLQAAVTRGLVGRNVARLAKAPGDRGAPKPIKAMTVTEVGKLLDGLKEACWHPIALVGVTTGLRPQELLALHWDDVHLDDSEPYVAVRHALTFTGGTALKAPKRERSYRTVPIPPEAVRALKAWKKEQAADRLQAGPLWSSAWSGLVFTTSTGTPHRTDNYRRAVAKAFKGATPHKLRHTYATHLLEAGTAIHHVAELLGDSVATTEATYSHSLRTKTEVTKLASALVH